MEEQVYEQSIFDEEAIPVTYASFWERFGALFIDVLVLLPLSVVNSYNRTHWNSTIIIILTALAALVYKPLLEYLYGATLGKKALSILVTGKGYDKPSLRKAILRNIFGVIRVGLAYGLLLFTDTTFSPLRTIFNYGLLQSPFSYSIILGVIYGLIYITDIIVFLADKENRSLHDFIGGTYVIRK